MILEIFEDDLTQDDLSNVHYHSSRAIIQDKEKVLLLYSRAGNFYMLPGGRIEENESPEACVVRELLEETGYHIKVVKESVMIQEHYSSSNWNTHFFLCQLSNGQKEAVAWTSEEEALDIKELWLDPYDAITLLDQHDTAYPHGYNIMQREFLALLNTL